MLGILAISAATLGLLNARDGAARSERIKRDTIEACQSTESSATDVAACIVTAGAKR